MEKKVINQEIGIAYEAIAESRILENGKLKKAYRGQVSTFGAAITMGSLLPAIAFLSKDGNSGVHRSRILDAILYILKKEGKVEGSYKNLFELVRDKGEQACKEDIINAAIALKLAMNLYNWEKEQ